LQCFSEGEHFIATSGFQEKDTVRRAETSPVFAESDIELLSKMTERGLYWLMNQLKLPLANSASEMVKSISDKSIALTSNEVPPIINDFIHSEESASNSPSQPALSSSQQVPNLVQKLYTEKDLEEMNMNGLREICRLRKLKKGKRKKDFVNVILQGQTIRTNVLDDLKKLLRSSSHKTSPPHHGYYKDYFNGVDLHDRFFYKQRSHHSIRNWEPKFIWSILQVGLNNSWALFCSIQDVPFLDFCETVSNVLIDPNLDIKSLGNM